MLPFRYWPSQYCRLQSLHIISVAQNLAIGRSSFSGVFVYISFVSSFCLGCYILEIIAQS